MDNCTEKYKISYLDFSRICRICLSVRRDIHLFQEEVIEKLNSFSDSKINLADGLPTHICKDCSCTVEKFYTFKKQLERSYYLLKEIQNKYIQQQLETYSLTENCGIKNTKDYIIEEKNDFIIKNEDIKLECCNDSIDICLWNDKNDIENRVTDVQLHTKSETDVGDDINSEIFYTSIYSDEKRGKETHQDRIRDSAFEKRKERSIQKTDLDEKTNDSNDTFASIQLRKKWLKKYNENQKTHSCNICNKVFLKRANFVRHMKKHKSKSEPCFCTHCNKWLKDENNLKIHINYAHQGPKKKETCPECGSTVVNIKIHQLKVHAIDRPFKCNECDKTFAKECFLNSHIKARHTRTEIHRFERLCNLCGKILANSAEFRNHMRSHTGERPFKCSLCSKSYRIKKSLTSHMHNHTGERPFECSICHKRYVTKRILQIHQLVHTGEKPHKCNICEQAFSQKSTLTTHTKLIHTGEKRNHSTKIVTKLKKIVSDKNSAVGHNINVQALKYPEIHNYGHDSLKLPN